MDAKKAGKISKALSDPTRVTILKEIKRNRDCLYCVDLNDTLDLAQPSISHHMKQLIDSELISQEKEGRNIKYSLNNRMLDEYVKFIEALKI